jgi:predicted metal-binding membrane protein
MAGLAGLIALSWSYLVPTAVDMYGSMRGLSAWMMTATRDTRYVVLVFVMWCLMMIGMMLPSAAPMILLFAKAVRGAHTRRRRSPLHWLSHRWQPGIRGALRMGAWHGVHCVGCCWMLMLLLFVGGVMNLLCIALIGGFVLFEKLAPFGPHAGRIGGALVVAAGVWLLVSSPA